MLNKLTEHEYIVLYAAEISRLWTIHEYIYIYFMY